MNIIRPVTISHRQGSKICKNIKKKTSSSSKQTREEIRVVNRIKMYTAWRIQPLNIQENSRRVRRQLVADVFLLGCSDHEIKIIV